MGDIGIFTNPYNVVDVYIMDTGVNEDVYFLKGKVASNWCLFDNCHGENGHGTTVACVLARWAPHARNHSYKVMRALVDRNNFLQLDSYEHYSGSGSRHMLQHTVLQRMFPLLLHFFEVMFCKWHSLDVHERPQWQRGTGTSFATPYIAAYVEQLQREKP